MGKQRQKNYQEVMTKKERQKGERKKEEICETSFCSQIKQNCIQLLSKRQIRKGKGEWQILEKEKRLKYEQQAITDSIRYNQEKLEFFKSQENDQSQSNFDSDDEFGLLDNDANENNKINANDPQFYLESKHVGQIRKCMKIKKEDKLYKRPQLEEKGLFQKEHKELASEYPKKQLEHLEFQLDKRKLEIKSRLIPYKKQRSAYQFFCQDMLTSEEFKKVKNPRDRFRMLSEAWKNIDIESLQKYNKMNKLDEERFEQDVMTYQKLISKSSIENSNELKEGEEIYEESYSNDQANKNNAFDIDQSPAMMCFTNKNYT
ncbi:UNKNOWN [Stylonychia lemnae]|uniref:HMG box domain-containing protein n=1 Tax=Stylonychia lemnae TaxID=5949 RepID=A0A078AIL4_STYLE|nr:UNKNOWN [Stylonychia lemnae]|eukprot:CDW82100.1 UNKNOWN [Stylonychia lemnae]